MYVYIYIYIYTCIYISQVDSKAVFPTLSREAKSGRQRKDLRYSSNSFVCKQRFSESWKCALRSCENLWLGIAKPGFTHPGQIFFANWGFANRVFAFLNPRGRPRARCSVAGGRLAQHTARRLGAHAGRRAARS